MLKRGHTRNELGAGRRGLADEWSAAGRAMIASGAAAHSGDCSSQRVWFRVEGKWLLRVVRQISDHRLIGGTAEFRGACFCALASHNPSLGLWRRRLEARRNHRKQVRGIIHCHSGRSRNPEYPSLALDSGQSPAGMTALIYAANLRNTTLGLFCYLFAGKALTASRIP